MSWPFEKVDATLKDIMRNIFEESRDNAAKYGVPDNYVAGANITAFMKVADVMIEQGLVEDMEKGLSHMRQSLFKWLGVSS